MASTLLRHVGAAHGADAVDELLRVAGVAYTPEFLDDVANWIWYDEAIALFEAAIEVTADQGVARRVGESTVRQHAGTPVATLLRSLGSPEAIYEQQAVAVSKFSTVTELVPLEVAPGRAVVRAVARPGFRRHRHLCDWTKGLLSQAPVLFGLPPAQVEESSCEPGGDDHCLYTITWDADRAASAADPRELATALETQLNAMNERLESMYATAQDLIAFDDVEAALARITERAATAVRAPRYLLAVRTGPGGALQVHHRGFVDEDPTTVAQALLEGDGDGDDEVRLVAEVESRSRHYGRLMAASPAGGFLRQERDLFAVYARYAASVLDTATALEEARREHRQSRALLELSRAVAEVTAGDEVAKRLVNAVPSVVDCDRVSVFLWSDRQEALTCRAVTESSGNRAKELQKLSISPSESPLIAELVEHPEPQPRFLEPATADEFLGGVMRRLDSKALVIVPIVAHTRFYGILTVSVIDRPDRLRPSSALKNNLAGVVAHAATALDNARLMETMSHQARHDSLTGLLSHRAFHEALGLLFADGRVFTLAMVDIDDFKLVNDLRGHPLGDEALKRVSDSMRACLRDDDAIFRIGGEEFAVLVPGLAADDAVEVAERLRRAVARTPFELPLRVSIGLASSPHDATDRDGLLERADAALYAAKAAGKDRTSVATAEEQAHGDHGSVPQELLDVLRRKDGPTLGHSAEVAAVAVSVGTALGLEPERLASLRLAAQLHDIGKVAVPDTVLNHPGPLDEQQLRLIHVHPMVGAEVAKAWGLAHIARFLLEHHEHFDGGGYPAGLAGEQISLEARIIHAVDAYCAMTAERPYRAALSADAARAELRACSGSQFDPDVVSALEAELEGQRPDVGADLTARR
jgi:diguanylate cyclase (GGDEF)-like protein